ncbi:MAG: serine hydrolase domain-containing protein [Nitrosopumilus sp.]
MTAKSLIKQHVKKSKSPGISVGLIDENGTQFFNYGEIKKDSGIIPTPDMIYEIGSMTKTFTAILAVKLQEERLLSLDDPITKFLPEFAGTYFDKNKITLYHLITHTSGLVEIPLRNYPRNLFAMIFRTNKGKVFPPRYSYDTSEFLEEVSQIKLKSNPGVTFRYSNTGVGLVGKILERITNSTYDKLIKDKICNRLEMNDTGIIVSETQKERLAMGYLYTGKEAEPINIPAVASAGSIRSTVSDMLKFLKANLELNKTDLSPVLGYCRTTKIKPKINPFLRSLSRLLYGVRSTEVGLGWIMSDLDNIKIIWHNGGTEGFSTLMMMDQGKKTGVVVLANHAFRDHHKLGVNLLKTASS